MNVRKVILKIFIICMRTHNDLNDEINGNFAEISMKTHVQQERLFLLLLWRVTNTQQYLNLLLYDLSPTQQDKQL